jgi:hypothetical protein
VEKAKVKIEKRSGLPCDEQRICVGSREMHDDSEVLPPGYIYVKLRLLGSGKKAQPVMTDDEKVTRLMLRLRSDTRPVEDAEYESLLIAVQKTNHLIKSLRSNESCIMNAIKSMSSKDLQAMFTVASEKASGGAGLAKIDSYGKLIFPIIEAVENHVGTMKSIYSEVTAEFRARFGKIFNNMQKEYGEVSHAKFKNAVDQVLTMKKDEEARATIEANIMEKMEAEMHEKAQAMAVKMFKDSKMKDADSDASNK